MTNRFHRILNRMALFTALLMGGLILCWHPFMQVACANIYLNGVIIGVTLFGIGLCFVHMFRLIPEYKWVCAFRGGRRNVALPPRLMRPAAILLRAGGRVRVADMSMAMDMVAIRIEDSREAIRYITNTLVFLGLLGTFWGLIMTVGGFAELIGGLNFEDAAVLEMMQQGVSKPLAGMATAFTSSLMGLAGSMTVGFLGLQMQMAQNTIYSDLEEYLAARTRVRADNENKN